MKKIILASFLLCVSYLSVDVFCSTDATMFDIEIARLNQMALSNSGELPGVDIVCSGGNGGACYTDGAPHVYLGPFGLPMCETTCKFSGYMSDVCASGMPC